MSLKFSGNFARLQKYVSRTGLTGKWRDLKYGQKQFRSDQGGYLNWWKTTGTMNFQGSKTAARDELARAFITVASSRGRLFGKYRGRSFCGRLRSLYPDNN
jgi:hypothetical protein